jgi:CRP/FNR family transcriptional regulator
MSPADPVALPPRPGSSPLLLRQYDPLCDDRSAEGDDDVSGRALNFVGRSVIFFEGDLVDWVYEVVSGVVMLYKLLPDGRRQVVEILGAGDVFGFSSSAWHDCSAESLTATRCSAFDRAALQRSPRLTRRLNACLYNQLCALHDHALLLGRKSAIERMTSFLMRWIPERGLHKCPGPPRGEDRADIRLAMTRQEIADYLGLTIETVSRALTKLKRRGVISIGRLDEIRIHDVCRLCRMTGTHLTRGRWCSSHEAGPLREAR